MSGRTILFVFAGRRRYLRLLVKYLRRELERGNLTEVHLWEMTGVPEDRDYIASLEGGGVTVKRDARLTGKHQWSIAYEYYNDDPTIGDDDVVIKCDDDVVYISDLEPLITYARSKTRPGLVYPNIVNNDVGAYWQVRDGLMPADGDVGNCEPVKRHLVDSRFGKKMANVCEGCLTDWYTRRDCGIWAFESFLRDPSAYELDKVHAWRLPQRVSINMFALRGRHVKKLFGFFLSKNHQGDEPTLSYRFHAEHRREAESAMVMKSVIVHFSFGPQAMPDERLGDLDGLAPTQLARYGHGDEAVVLEKLDALAFAAIQHASPWTPAAAPVVLRRGAGRKIPSTVVVGSGGSVTDFAYGTLIDSFERVVRCNTARVEGFEKHVGSKTTHRVVNEDIPRHAQNRWVFQEGAQIIVTIPYMDPAQNARLTDEVKRRLDPRTNRWRRGQPAPVVIPLERQHDMRDTYGLRHPTCGFAALYHFSKNFTDPVAVVGFDFFTNAKSHYWQSDPVQSQRQATNARQFHSADRERTVVEEQFADGHLVHLGDLARAP